MADTKISALTELASADIATSDVLAIADVSTTTTKKVQVGSIFTKFTAPIYAGAPGGSDDTALFTAAEAALPAGGGMIVLGRGAYALPSGYSFTKAVRLVGQGLGDPYGSIAGTFDDHTVVRGLTSILCSSTTAVCLTFAADGSSLADLAIINTNAGNPSAGSGVKFTSSNAMRMNNVGVVGFYDCIDIDNGGVWVIDGCVIMNPVRYGIRIRNTDEGDEGDALIGGGTAIIATDRAATAGIQWESGGGLKVLGIKVNAHAPDGGDFTHGIHIAGADTTSVFTITGNSIENVVTCITLDASGQAVGNISIVGNEMALADYGVTTGAGIYNVLIDQNTFAGIATACINLAGGDKLRVGSLNSLSGDGTLILDTTSGVNAAACEHDYRRPLPTTTSKVTYSALYRFGLPQYYAGIIRFTIGGIAQGVGPWAISGVRSITRTTGNITIATVGTDTNVSSYAEVELNFDVTTVSGEVRPKIRLAGAATATDLEGIAVFRVESRLASVKVGA